MNLTGIALTQDGGISGSSPAPAGNPGLRSAATGFTVHPGHEKEEEKMLQIPAHPAATQGVQPRHGHRHLVKGLENG